MNEQMKRLLSLLDHRRYSRRSRFAISAVMLVTLVTATWISWAHLGLTLAELRLIPTLLVLLTAPLSFALSAMEYRLLARALGRERSWREASEVSVIGYTSNLLPLPGGALIRVSSLTGQSGESPRKPTQVTLLLAALWLGMAVLFGGLGLTLLGRVGIGLYLSGCGVALAVTSLVAGSRSISRPRFSAFAYRAVGLEAAFVLLAVVRTYLAFSVISVEASIQESMVIASSNALSSTIGVVPAGVGIREGIAAMLSAFVGIPAAAGLIASVLLRLSGLLVASIGTALLMPPNEVRPSQPKSLEN